MMDIHEILTKLPHRYPFLLIDRFPIRPVMPGVLMLEALAQTAALLAFETLGQLPDEKTIYYLAALDAARFKRPVEPGDQLVLEATLIRNKSSVYKFSCSGQVGGSVVVEAELTCTMRKLI
jgi:3-hydroxyacyl-[acyl-carrier-protein] dehydratase